MTIPACVCVVLHDVAAGTLAACERTVRAVEQVAGALPLTLLAVPRYHGRAPTRTLVQWLDRHAARHDEIALHGYTHLDDRPRRGLFDRLRRDVYTRGEAEFWDLAADDAALRLHAGADWFAGRGWALHGFVAPAWLLGPGAWQALRASPGFGYTSTLRAIHLLPEGARIASWGIAYSSAARWRRVASTAWAPLAAALQRRNPVLRLELHPSDADHAGIRRSWQRLLGAALRDREPLTVADAVARWRRATAAAARAPTAPPRG